MPVSLMFQSTRPHGARRARTSRAAVHSMFQSTRPHGARRLRGCRPCRPGRFNPRARTGRDPFLPRGPAISRQFQSTRPHGARRFGIRKALSPILFQSTRPHGARRRSSAACTSGEGFNPRARTGRDAWISARQRPSSWFQSTRPHGARPVGPGRLGILRMVSIHAPARGATRAAGPPSRSFRVSIHAPARGATLPGQLLGHVAAVSIHAPARGATQQTGQFST